MIGGIAQVKIVLRSRGKFPDSSGFQPVTIALAPQTRAGSPCYENVSDNSLPSSDFCHPSSVFALPVPLPCLPC